MTVYTWTHVDPQFGCCHVSYYERNDGLITIIKNGFFVTMGSPEALELKAELDALLAADA